MYLYFIISFAASIVGAICGIGGGVIIKPVLDLIQVAEIDVINFLSGCTVLSMSCYSVVRSIYSGEKRVSVQTGTPLAIGAAIGGLFGKKLFSLLCSIFENQDAVAAVQAACLALITVGTLVYTLCKGRIRSHSVQSKSLCTVIGLVLGLMSSFLGIGGGPINLVVLYYFFSMDTKTAAANSLYIILFSQLASLLTTLLTHAVPEFPWIALILMVVGGIVGGITGRIFNRKMDNCAVERLFVGLMILIIGICVYNFVRCTFGG